MTATSKKTDKPTEPQTLAVWLKAVYSEKHKIACKFKKNDEWFEKNYADYLKTVVHLQSFLKENKIEKKSKVALMSATRWEWAALDVATLSYGAILVPIYPNLTDEDVLYILNHSEADLLIVDTKKTASQFERILKNLNKKINCLIIDDLDFDESYVTDFDIENLIKKAEHLKLNDPITIIYTSGTTGQPKGVLLLQEALISEVAESFDMFDINENDMSLAFLPYAHVMGRIEHWGCFYKRAPVAYAESVDALKRNLVEIKPTFLVAVPRIFEKIFSAISAKIETSPLKKNIFDKTLSLAKKMRYYRETNQSAPLLEAIAYEVFSKIAFSPVQEAFGGRLRFAISGGAPLSPELGRFFANMNIRLFEGYGLTETFAAITVNTESNWKLGTVGKPIGDVKIKFATDGEILVKSKKCLKEYYKNPEATKASIDSEGYFATGDIGEFDEQGYLKITDRKKDLLKTAGGKYVAPQKLEGLLKEEPIISQVLICGDQKKFVSALITVESLPVSATADEKHVVLNKVKIQVQKVNSKLASFESIKKFEIIFETWSIENGCLTPSMKVKRKFILERYSHIIKEFYGEDD